MPRHTRQVFVDVSPEESKSSWSVPLAAREPGSSVRLTAPGLAATKLLIFRWTPGEATVAARASATARGLHDPGLSGRDDLSEAGFVHRSLEPWSWIPWR